MWKLTLAFGRRSHKWSGRKNYSSSAKEASGSAQKISRSNKWLRILSALGILSGAVYVGDLALNDDLDQITNFFRKKLSPEEQKDR